MAATGRPTKLDDLTAKRICDAIKGGSSVARTPRSTPHGSARASGTSPSPLRARSWPTRSKSCTTIHADWRETYAVMLYEYLRPGEGRVLEWETDVDFIKNKIRVSKAWDYEEQCVKPTKT
jgi:hypothetical protein